MPAAVAVTDPKSRVVAPASERELNVIRTA